MYSGKLNLILVDYKKENSWSKMENNSKSRTTWQIYVTETIKLSQTPV